MLWHFDAIRQDLQYAVRHLRRSPGYAAVTIGSLAIGIGANVTIYSGARAFLRRPPDAVRPHELVRVYLGGHSPLGRDRFLHLARHSQTLSDLVAEDPMPLGLVRGGTPERVMASVVSENFFRALGVGPALGAVFAGEPGEPIGAVAVLSHDFWSTRLGADSSAIGATVRLNDVPFTVVGVAREGFRSSQFGWGPHLFVPLSEQARLRGAPPEVLGQSSFYVTGRLALGRTPEEAQTELRTVSLSPPDASPEAAEGQAVITVEPARGITAEVRTPATLVSGFLMGVVGLVLLIACANLANLLLARAAGRRREIAIRTALGVSRSRLVRQLLTESILLAVVGGTAGVWIAFSATRQVVALLPATGEFAFDLTPDLNVLLFAAALAVATGVLFGLAPAVQASRTDAQTVLRAESAGSGSRRSRLRSAFLVAQVTLATVLLMTAARFLVSLDAAGRIDIGFSSERVADLPIDLSLRQYDAARGQVFYRGLLERVSALPGVEAATLARVVPLTGSRWETGVSLASADPSDREASRQTTFTSVAPGYFEMFGIPIVQGRSFGPGDREGAPQVAVVNQTFARMLWPDADPVGQAVRFGGDQTLTVVGVARDVKYVSLGEDRVPFVYLPASQEYSPAMVLQVRLAQDTPAERNAVRAAVLTVDPGLPLGEMRAMGDDMQISLLLARVGAGLTGAFGFLALFLASIGVYGVTAYLVGQRASEIGVRTALGGTPGAVMVLMMRDTLLLVVAGLGLGLVGGVGLGAAISSWLYGVGALDPKVLGPVMLVLLGMGLLGTWLPARRVLGVDPVLALRAE